MFVSAYMTWQSYDGVPSTEGHTPVFVALSTVQTITEIGHGWTELRTHNHLTFYVPRPPAKLSEGGMAFGMVTA